MKRILLFAVTLLAVTFAFSQNVGIGTTTPAAKLDVKTTSSYVGQFNGAAPMYMGIFENDIYRGYWGSYSGAAEDVDFGTGSGTTGKLHLTIQASPKLTIDNTGNVGIGTTSPTHRLHINTGDLFIQSSAGSLRFGYEGSNQWKFPTTNGGADFMMHTSLDGTTFTPQHYFAQNGNVGIGTGVATPIGRLEIKGTGISSTSNNLVLRNSAGDTLLRMRDDGRMGIGYNGASYGRTMNLGGSGVNFYTANEAGFGGAIFPTDTSLVIWSNSGSNNYVVLQPSWGNTGVGTYSPNAKFHVNGAMLIGSNTDRVATGYSLSVAGKIISEELKVQLRVSWPDYVFDDDYKLLPIEELENSINKNKHLPNIPSASDIIADKGFEVGDMNRRLLEKVEELTLYLIDANKKINSLQNQVNKLEKKGNN